MMARGGRGLISGTVKDKPEVVDLARDFAEGGFKIIASRKTCQLLQEAWIEAQMINKLQEGRPNMLDLITNGEVDLIINTPIGRERQWDDSYLRKTAIKKKVPYMTTIAAAKATISGIKAMKRYGGSEVRSLQELHSLIKDK